MDRVALFFSLGQTCRTKANSDFNLTKSTRMKQLFDAETWVFDLDNTLYPAASNLFDQVDRRMCGFIAETLDLPHADAYKLQKQYFREHGTTLRGLMTVHNIDPAAFLDYVHDIDVTPVPPSPILSGHLQNLPGRKVIFTNGSVAHADRVTQRLGIDHHFDDIFDIVASDYTPKPDPGVYQTMINALDIDPTKAVMVEDMAKNLVPAAALGMATVWVRNDTPWSQAGDDTDYIDHVTEDLTTWLGQVLPPLPSDSV